MKPTPIISKTINKLTDQTISIIFIHYFIDIVHLRVKYCF